MKKILFVCTGNICRSPAAEGILRHQLNDLGISRSFIIDSAAISAYHIGETPDYRAVLEAEKRGIDLSQMHARQVVLDDFYEFDLILGMTNDHLNFLQAKKPQDSNAHIDLLLKFSEGFKEEEVSDPYYGGEEGFSLMFDLLEDACDRVIKKLNI